MGVKQGCPLSPLLFGMYLDDLEGELAAGQHGMDFPLLSGSPVHCIMYADDLAQAATSAEGLQRQMRHVEEYAARWGLTINAGKTKVVVFANRRDQAAEDQVQLRVGGSLVEVLDSFTYLGVSIHASAAFAGKAAAARKATGRRAMHGVRRRLTDLDLGCPHVQFRLFDVMVDSVLSYGVEVWGPQLLCDADPCTSSPEKLQLAFLRGVLGVRQGTASRVVLAECGRWPLALRWAKRLTKFYNGLVQAPSGSLLARALAASSALAAAPSPGPLARQSWMAQWVSALGLWGVQLEAAQPRGLDAGAVCRAWVQWYLHSTRAQQGTKIRYYFHDVRGGLPDSEYVAPQYLSAAKRRAWRRALTQLRTGAHWLREETGRWERLEREARV